jgi:hypothetical protein
MIANRPMLRPEWNVVKVLDAVGGEEVAVIRIAAEKPL